MLVLSLLLGLSTAHAAPCANVSGPGPLRACILAELADQEAFDDTSRAVVTGLLQRLSTVETHNGQLEQRVQTLEAHTTDLEARLAALETFITADVPNDTLTLRTSFGSIVVDSGEDLTVSVYDDTTLSTGGLLDIDAADHVTLDGARDLTLTAVEALAVDGGTALQATTGGNLGLSAVGDLDADATNVSMTALGAIDLTAGSAATIAAGSTVTLQAAVANAQVSVMTLDGDLVAPSIGSLTVLEARVRNLETQP